MTWNYRIVKRTIGDRIMFGIHSAYYTDGKLDGLSENPVSLGYFDGVEDICLDLPRLTRALEMPVVCYENLEEGDRV